MAKKKVKKAKKVAMKKASYEEMVYTDDKTKKVYNAPKGYKLDVVPTSEEIEKMMRETPLG